MHNLAQKELDCQAPSVVAIWERIPKWALSPIPGLSRSARLTLVDLYGLRMQNGPLRGKVGGSGWTIARIAGRLGRTKRSLQRDLEELCRWGCDCTAHPGSRDHQGGLLARQRGILDLPDRPKGLYFKTWAPPVYTGKTPWSEPRPKEKGRPQAAGAGMRAEQRAPKMASPTGHRGKVITDLDLKSKDRKTGSGPGNERPPALTRADRLAPAHLMELLTKATQQNKPASKEGNPDRNPPEEQAERAARYRAEDETAYRDRMVELNRQRMRILSSEMTAGATQDRGQPSPPIRPEAGTTENAELQDHRQQGLKGRTDVAPMPKQAEGAGLGVPPRLRGCRGHRKKTRWHVYRAFGPDRFGESVTRLVCCASPGESVRKYLSIASRIRQGRVWLVGRTGTLDSAEARRR